MDPDVERLVREERLLEAASLASDQGDARTASLLYERACDWTRAAAEALRGGDAPRALELASFAGDEAVCDRALPLVAQHAARIDAVAARLEQRGRPAWAARLLEAGGRTIDAARAWDRAGDPLRAAELLERARDPAGAARVLEAAVRSDRDAWPAAVALGELLARFGKDEAAVRVLQQVPAGDPKRRAALDRMIPALERLGLDRAAEVAAAELTTLGGSLPSPPEGASAGSATPPGIRLLGRYDVVREIASSPSARVLECLDVARGERVAVKLFAAWDARGTGRDALARFEREARAMRALDHPNVVPLRDVVAEGPAIVLAWMSGGTLERVLATAGPLAPARAVEISACVLSALGEAHRLGILHRDVKPSNVLFDDAGGARLSDFGVAHLGDLSTTATAGVFGTLAYMSPEQREGRPSTARSDVFAVGVMLREMLTGERPSPSDPPRLRPSDAHPELDAAHDALVERMTARDPRERPGDAFEARRELAALRWPSTSPGTADARAPVSGARGERRSSASPAGARLEVGPQGRLIDGWTGRAIERVPLSEGTLERARAFAVADHPALQPVLRVAPEDDALWLGAVAADTLNRPLTVEERKHLAAGIRALHEAGAVHGSIDREHVAIDAGGVVLRFGAPPPATATAADDGLALARL
jgi:serine/threonine-protein kinase